MPREQRLNHVHELFQWHNGLGGVWSVEKKFRVVRAGIETKKKKGGAKDGSGTRTSGSQRNCK